MGTQGGRPCAPPVERLDKGDVPCVVGGEFWAQQPEGSADQTKRGKSGQRDVRKVLDGLLDWLVGDRASVPSLPKNCSCLNIDEIRCGEFSVLTEQITGLPTGRLVVADRCWPSRRRRRRSPVGTLIGQV